MGGKGGKNEENFIQNLLLIKDSIGQHNYSWLKEKFHGMKVTLKSFFELDRASNFKQCNVTQNRQYKLVAVSRTQVRDGWTTGDLGYGHKLEPWIYTITKDC